MDGWMQVQEALYYSNERTFCAQVVMQVYPRVQQVWRIDAALRLEVPSEPVAPARNPSPRLDSKGKTTGGEGESRGRAKPNTNKSTTIKGICRSGL